jgi:hypothetical protein
LYGNDFDPDNISKEDMRKLAEHIEEYVDTLEEVMIIPEELQKEYGDRIHDGLKVTRKLIEKLRKGDRSVFKDKEDWNSII